MIETSSVKVSLLTGRVPYPHGMASSQRIHLIARALQEGGAKVNVLVDGLDTAGITRNNTSRGCRDGVNYEYLVNKTTASPRKWRRILDRLWISYVARRRVLRDRSERRLDALYYYTSGSSLDFERLVIGANLARNTIPTVMDFRETPWSLETNRSLGERLLSPLWGANGAICISQFLLDWVKLERVRLGVDVTTILVPILVDMEEFARPSSRIRAKSVVFAASPAYDKTFMFLVRAMASVWSRHPDCELIVTGGAREEDYIGKEQAPNCRIRFTGYLDRQQLVDQYYKASVLAIPLHNDIRSIARFPTKLGEYLAASRPIVTNSVGEIPRYLTDRATARLVDPDVPEAFGEAVSELLSYPEDAEQMGIRGRLVAKQHFHYANYGKQLAGFFSTLAVKYVCVNNQQPFT